MIAARAPLLPPQFAPPAFLRKQEGRSTAVGQARARTEAKISASEKTAFQSVDSALLHVRVQPKSSRNEVVGFDGGALKVRVTAPPADGEANAALLGLLAHHFGCPRSALTLVRGRKSRDKWVRISGPALHEMQQSIRQSRS